ncbi:MAG: hypothetical protein WBC92_14005 [Terracidiphilus sp.]
MSRRSTSPFGIFAGIILIGTAAFVYLTLTPKLTVTPVPTADRGAVFGMMFNLKNSGLATLREVTSTVCVNNFMLPGRSEPATGGVVNHGNTNEVAGLSDLEHGDTVSLPFENVTPGPPGSKVDLVFLIRFQPGWWLWKEERRFRFSGTRNLDKSWLWQAMPLGGPCGSGAG